MNSQTLTLKDIHRRQHNRRHKARARKRLKSNVITLIIALSVLWMAGSYAEVLMNSGKGLDGNDIKYNRYNYFMVLGKIMNANELTALVD